MSGLLLRITVAGDLRFISHRDTVRMLTRALVRAGLPLVYSKGFNPHPRLSLLLPRPVGMSADDDPLIVQLAADLPPDEVQARLAPQLPEGARLLEVVCLPPGERPRLTAAYYEIELDDSGLTDLLPVVERFNAAHDVVVERSDEKGRSKSPFNIRPYVQDLRIDGCTLKLTTRFELDRTAALRDVLPALGLPWDLLRHKIRRRKVECN